MFLVQRSWHRGPTRRHHTWTLWRWEILKKKKASSQQSCGIDNRTERLTSGTHDPDHRWLHRATWDRSREGNRISPLETLTSWPHSVKSLVRDKNRAQNRKNDIYHASDDHLPWFAQIRGSRGRRNENFFPSTTKLTKIMVEGVSSTTTEWVSRGRWALFF
jgi:hypothetical protein